MKSTGPTSEEGKKRACINGRRHDLTGAGMLMADEDRAAYEAFTEPMIESMNPSSPQERNFAYLIAQAHYRLNRIHAIEEKTFAMGHFNRAADFETDHDEVRICVTHARVFDMKGDVFKNLSLYEQRISRQLEKNMKLLRDLQDRRQAEERQAALEAEKEAMKPKVLTAGAGQPDCLSNPLGLIPAESTDTSGLIPTEAASPRHSYPHPGQSEDDMSDFVVSNRPGLIPTNAASPRHFYRHPGQSEDDMSWSNGFGFSNRPGLIATEDSDPEIGGQKAA